jgi:hypothetical protein
MDHGGKQIDSTDLTTTKQLSNMTSLSHYICVPVFFVQCVSHDLVCLLLMYVSSKLVIFDNSFVVVRSVESFAHRHDPSSMIDSYIPRYIWKLFLPCMELSLPIS